MAHMAWHPQRIRVSVASMLPLLTRTAAMSLVLLLLAGCSQTGQMLRRTQALDEPVNVVAVLPIERAADAGAERVMRDAERIVTAQVYGALAESPRWRMVSDVAVADALRRVSPGLDTIDRAQALGRLVDADAVVIGTVARFVEREGTAIGSEAPASIALRLALVSVRSGDVLWDGEFNETQQPLSSNLLNFWQFWRGGPRWFTAAEFSRLGVERLLEDLGRRAK